MQIKSSVLICIMDATYHFATKIQLTLRLAHNMRRSVQNLNICALSSLYKCRLNLISEIDIFYITFLVYAHGWRQS